MKTIRPGRHPSTVSNGAPVITLEPRFSLVNVILRDFDQPRVETDRRRDVDFRIGVVVVKPLHAQPETTENLFVLTKQERQDRDPLLSALNARRQRVFDRGTAIQNARLSRNSPVRKRIHNLYQAVVIRVRRDQYRGLGHRIASIVRLASSGHYHVLRRGRFDTLASFIAGWPDFSAMTFVDDLPILIRIVLLISSALILVVGAGLFWRMLKALFGKKDNG